MAAPKPIQIVGGGPAGLTLGIALRQQEIPVTICEAGHYPRHRVCGEFISGRGQQTLARLGLRELFEQAGAVKATTAVFYSANQSTLPRALPAGAICLSRFAMDVALANKFRELGGELQTGRRFSENFGEGFVRATGRRAQAEPNGVRWFGLKVHARNVRLAADLEMHVSPRGYVGLCRVEGGAVDVCGLFRRCTNENAVPQNWRELLHGPMGSPLNRRLEPAEFDENSFCAVAGLSMQPKRATARAEISVGDAITMIPPVTGNGLSMSFESAELSAGPLAAWSRGEISWPEARRQAARDCDAAFARRLKWAKWFQRLMLAPSLQSMLVALVARNDWFWRKAFERTR